MILKIELDYMNGPLWKETFDVVDTNEEINSQNKIIQEIYNSLYEL